MNKNFNELLCNFKKISKKKWIQSIALGHGNVGLTFEHELGKKIDSDFSPDYKDIELKCTTRFSRFPITLFSLIFDGPTNKEIIRLNETYGSFDKDINDKKSLIRKIRVGEFSLINSKYKLSLLINDDKLFLCVYDLKDNLLEKTSFVYINTIKQHLLTKINNLAIIKASKKSLNNKEYFRYYEINFYKLKNFSVFLELLKNGYIEVTLNSRMQKSGKYIGRHRNKGLVFQIKKDNIEKLFDRIYRYNYDEYEVNELQFL